MTDPTPDLCCEHGAKLDRILELMEDVHAARVGNAHQHEPEPNEHQSLIWKAARDEVLARPSTGDYTTDHDGQHLELATGGPVMGPGRLIAGNGIDCVFPFTADTVRAANPSPAIDPEAVASDAIRVHLSPAESVIPGPNGPIHIRGAYGDEPAQVTEIYMDDLEDDED